jgi:hypothetical protein
VLGSPDGIAIMSADRLLELLGDASSLRDHLTGIDGLGPHER